eukprot:551171_1
MMLKLLVYGYCREIEHYLDDKIIPNGITELCFIYYLSSTLIFYFYVPSTQSKMKSNKNIIIHDMESKKKFDCTIESTNGISTISSNISYTRHLTLPFSIQQKFFNTNNKISNYQALIVSVSSVSHMLVFNEQQLHSNSTTTDEPVTIYDWTLPNTFNAFDRSNSGTIDIFSKKNGLFKLGGYDGQHDKNDFYRLPFDGQYFNKQDLKNWKWQKMANMKHPRYKGSGVIIKNNNINNEKLVIVGGYYYDSTGSGGNYPQSVEIFDFETNKWNELCTMKNPREEMGIFYDKEYGNNMIYIGGGVSYVGKHRDTNTVECFDLYKMKWINYGHTNMKHINYPIFWKENKYRLFIASNKYGIECIDLREKNNVWIKDKSHFANWNGQKSASYICN